MKHRIVVLGAGYAGAFAAGNLARRLSPEDTEITMVNAEPVLVERLRPHQVAAGQEIGAPKLTDVFAGTGVRLVWPASPPSTPRTGSSPRPVPTAAANSGTTHSSTRSAATSPIRVCPA